MALLDFKGALEEVDNRLCDRRRPLRSRAHIPDLAACRQLKLNHQNPVQTNPDCFLWLSKPNQTIAKTNPFTTNPNDPKAETNPLKLYQPKPLAG